MASAKEMMNPTWDNCASRIRFDSGMEWRSFIKTWRKSLQQRRHAFCMIFWYFYMRNGIKVNLTEIDKLQRILLDGDLCCF